MLFAPSGQNRNYFQFYANRVNAGGWRSPFPSGIPLVGADLRETSVWLGKLPIYLAVSNISGTRLVAGEVTAELTLGKALRLGRSEKWATRLILLDCDLGRAHLADGFGRELRSQILRCDLRETNFSFADLWGARFERCDIDGANFGNAHLENTEFIAMPRPDVAPTESFHTTGEGVQ